MENRPISLSNQPHNFAEIVEGSLYSWRGQTWQWNNFPAFGSLVVIETKRRTLFGIVYQVQTGSMDPSRYPFAYQKTQEELLQEQPQIFEFLQTTFLCLTVGYYENNTFTYHIAPEPPAIHSFIRTATLEEYKKFFSCERYLYPLFGYSGQMINLDELILAIFKNQKDLKLLTPELLKQSLETFSLLTNNDYKRLKLFTNRVQTLLENLHV